MPSDGPCTGPPIPRWRMPVTVGYAHATLCTVGRRSRDVHPHGPSAVHRTERRAQARRREHPACRVDQPRLSRTQEHARAAARRRTHESMPSVCGHLHNVDKRADDRLGERDDGAGRRDDCGQDRRRLDGHFDPLHQSEHHEGGVGARLRVQRLPKGRRVRRVANRGRRFGLHKRRSAPRCGHGRRDHRHVRRFRFRLDRDIRRD